jgi:ribosomal protein L2
MNPIDHPLGGGEGHATAAVSISKTGVPAKGGITRDPNKQSKADPARRKFGTHQQRPRAVNASWGGGQ